MNTTFINIIVSVYFLHPCWRTFCVTMKKVPSFENYKFMAVPGFLFKIFVVFPSYYSCTHQTTGTVRHMTFVRYFPSRSFYRHYRPCWGFLPHAVSLMLSYFSQLLHPPYSLLQLASNFNYQILNFRGVRGSLFVSMYVAFNHDIQCFWFCSIGFIIRRT